MPIPADKMADFASLTAGTEIIELKLIVSESGFLRNVALEGTILRSWKSQLGPHAVARWADGSFPHICWLSEADPVCVSSGGKKTPFINTILKCGVVVPRGAWYTAHTRSICRPVDKDEVFAAMEDEARKWIDYKIKKFNTMAKACAK